jgi:hypothetical protein
MIVSDVTARSAGSASVFMIHLSDRNVVDERGLRCGMLNALHSERIG